MEDKLTIIEAKEDVESKKVSNLNKFNGYLKSVFTDKFLLLPLLLIMLLAYSFMLFNDIISIDTFTQAYVEQTYMLGQGRFTAYVFNHIVPIFSYVPGLSHLLSAGAIFCSALFLIAIVKLFTNDALNKWAYLFLGATFLATPIVAELFPYVTTWLLVGILFVLACYAFVLTLDFLERKNIWNLVISSILLTFIISGYESIAVLYFFFIPSYYLLQYLFVDKDLRITKKVFVNVLYLIVPIIIGFVAEFVISKLIIIIFDIKTNTMGANNANLFSALFSDFIGTIWFIISRIAYFYLTKGVLTTFGQIFSLSTVFFFIYFIVIGIKRKNVLPFICILLMWLSVFALFFLLLDMAFRMMQVMQVYNAIAVGILFDKVIKRFNAKKFVKIACVLVIGLSIVSQTVSLATRLNYNVLRYNYEKQVAVTIANDVYKNNLQDKDIVYYGFINDDKYIIDVGLGEKLNSLEYEYAKLFNKIMSKYDAEQALELNGRYFVYGANGNQLLFNKMFPNKEFYRELGYELSFKTINKEDAENYVETATAENIYENYIIDCGDFVIVNLNVFNNN